MILKYSPWTKIHVYTDHKHLMYKSHNSAHVMRWRLLMKEVRAELIYLPGVNNIIANCLSRIKYEDNNNITYHIAFNEEDINTYPMSYKLIMKYQ